MCDKTDGFSRRLKVAHSRLGRCLKRLGKLVLPEPSPPKFPPPHSHRYSSGLGRGVPRPSRRRGESEYPLIAAEADQRDIYKDGNHRRHHVAMWGGNPHMYSGGIYLLTYLRAIAHTHAHTIVIRTSSQHPPSSGHAWSNLASDISGKARCV